LGQLKPKRIEIEDISPIIWVIQGFSSSNISRSIDGLSVITEDQRLSSIDWRRPNRILGTSHAKIEETHRLIRPIGLVAQGFESWILLFTQTDLLIPKWNDQNALTWLKSR